MATIDSRGLVDDGSSNLTVAGSAVVSGPMTVPYKVMSTTVQVSGSNVLTAPGMFQYNGGNFTVPSAASFPGATMVFAPTAATSSTGLTGVGCFLTGTAVVGTVVFAAQAPGTIDAAAGTKLAGSKLTLGSSGSVVLVSDSNFWLVMTHSGSLTFA